MENSVEDFLIYVKESKKMSENTVVSYRRDLKGMLSYFEKQGIESLEKVTSTNINSYILFLEKNGKSPASISRSISSMRAYFRYLLIHGVIKGEPTEKITMPKVEKKVPSVITAGQIEDIIKAANGSDPKSIRDRAMLELLYATGMRVSELISLNVDDINLQLSYVICRNAKKERVIPFGNKAKQSLSKYLSKARPALMQDNNMFLFVNCFGKQMSRQGFWKIIKEYANKAGIKEEISPHTIRHSFGAHLIGNGADVKSVQQMMGHVDIASTEVYRRMESENLRSVYEKAHPRGKR